MARTCVAPLQIHTPLAVISGHSRAVSYVRWLGSDSIVSASTDNHLKLWDVGTATQSLTGCKPVMSYTGDARPACSGLELTLLRQVSDCTECNS